ncbi:translocase [Photorhabdus temperata]|uniref:Bactoprenol-linked glucose translocase n=1 Tax=Photorhabdus khanii NC19 TaxID=1004151 RepID=W3V9S9_9GAMM|nr:GtrA family protein [Photorhabdus khanii]ETS31890.1 putative membrane protein [Photorhabdus khanii NC19]OHV51241.1 translocase [Photorhabdus temperata]
MIKLFTKYVSIGAINTLIHWTVFGVVHHLLDATQAVSNLAGFSIAVTFSFFTNARITFKVKATGERYMSFISFMGLLSFLTGYLSDKMDLPTIATLIIFSAISLVLGFIYSKYFVFKGKE